MYTYRVQNPFLFFKNHHKKINKKSMPKSIKKNIPTSSQNGAKLHPQTDQKSMQISTPEKEGKLCQDTSKMESKREPRFVKIY